MSLEGFFKDKRVLVTGAGRGLGKAIAVRLHGYGALVFALSKTHENLEKLQEECPNVKTICVNLEDWELTRTSLENIEGGPMDCLVNNAGILINGNFLDVQPQDFDKTFNVNVKAIINVGQVVAQGMIDGGFGGSIVNVSSLSSGKIFPNGLSFGASKAAMDLITRTMASELGKYKIRVNSVNPSMMITDMTKEKAERAGIPVEDAESALRNLGTSSRVPLGTLVVPVEEVVNTILFLLSNQSSMINGEMVIIDGGYSAT